ncbi:MAG: hypothetical protein M5U28_07585 [Sandaracinaceae bacterium]|nr:hypothetical protein [Sandaracinaceae bacterium]
MLLFGRSYDATGATFYADLWRFDVASESWSWSLPEETGRPAHRVGGARSARALRGLGYSGDMRPLGDLWYADLDALAWAEIALTDGRPRVRARASAAGSEDRPQHCSPAALARAPPATRQLVR